MRSFNLNRCKLITASVVLTISLYSCSNFLDIDAPKSKIVKSVVFKNDITATQAVIGMYNTMVSVSSFSSGDATSVATLAALSADEIQRHPRDNSANSSFYQFDENSLTSRNDYITSLWRSMYQVLYQSNDIILGLSSSDTVTPNLKNQLIGEAMFIRAFINFYLINLFGEVPLLTSTDYELNSLVTRTNTDEIYAAIQQDLESAKASLSESYPTIERVRPNKFAASALLARVHLYRNNWRAAELEASIVLDQQTMYDLEDLSNVFLRGSKEAIWQLMPLGDTNSPSSAKPNTLEALTFVPSFFFFSPDFSINEPLLNSFDASDQRKISWLAQDFNTGAFYPFKYKAQYTDEVEEYSIVLRLAEIFLIRAEAKANLTNLSDAILDLDIIRERAGLPSIKITNPGISKGALLLEIEKERKLELFTEWGHRWLDLKRTGRANTILPPIKTGWSSNDQLYPIPLRELETNPKLGNQNPGY